ncbi:hypothetical protein GCM10027285_08690 [Oleiagrimonas citrea]|uniref:Uncharacterized protein n=1 Tax=Oleiagrimonas citrea TaxID=1665687 RepID=A0A846ZLY6_9GAMM|nr:hypothetical protein [Oleiagrimonas citrea]NKZ38568.1 hypothetical protein [Oleiagrimonas citrea]
MTELQRERLFPWLWGVCSAAALLVGHYVWGLQMPTGDSYKSALLTLGGIFAGFMATLTALLYSMRDETFERLRDSKYLKDLLDYLHEALWSSLLLCFVTWVSFWVPDSCWFLQVVLGGLAVFTMAAIFRIAKIASSLLADR